MKTPTRTAAGSRRAPVHSVRTSTLAGGRLGRFSLVFHRSRIRRLHPGRGAPLQVQLVARHDRQYIRRVVTSRMADAIIELRPEIRVQGHGTDQDAVVL